jgi:uncharacterized protein YutE (UPF0331/DUF86 family)
MGWLQFLDKLIGHLLSWPVFAVVAVVLFRPQIRSLIVQVRSYEGLGQKLTFGDELAQAEEDVEELAASRAVESAQQAGDETQETWRSYADLAERAPSAAILMAWAEVEKAANSLVDRYGLQDQGRRPRTTGELFRLLIDRRIVPGSMLRAFDRLRALRNQVAHGMHEPTAGEALTYIETARSVTDVLQHLAAFSDEEGAQANPSEGHT